MRVHFISIGGSAMHSLAIAMKEEGHHVSGSDDEIYDPSRSRLESRGLLPTTMGWNAANITQDIQQVILGMHARADNPELLRAQELNIPMLSYPAFIRQYAADKKRIVVAGSHGKTTTSSMIMHALKYWNKDFDYLLGAQLKGFNNSVSLSKAPIIVIEGDEYLCSALDRSAKMIRYEAHVGIITGIEWDHINVFPTYEDYILQFEKFIESIEPGGTLIYNELDPKVKALVSESSRKDLTKVGYGLEDYHSPNMFMNRASLFPMQVFGKHNFQNMNAAYQACNTQGISRSRFLNAMRSFTGAKKRLQKISDTPIIYSDFAHAPSKLKATVEAVKEMYPDKSVVCCFELHTYSSFNPEFIPLYKGSLNKADKALVYCSDHAMKIKKMDPLSDTIIQEAFEQNGLVIGRKKEDIARFLEECQADNSVYLMMSSGTFDGADFVKMIKP